MVPRPYLQWDDSARHFQAGIKGGKILFTMGLMILQDNLILLEVTRDVKIRNIFSTK